MPQHKKRIHFIAIGGSVMHNLAIALKEAGHHVSGSDDEITDPSRARLAAHGLLPESQGWHPSQITADLNAVVLGMHARDNNPELLRAQELKIRIYSFPEYIFEASQDKQRIVIAGSHGKTTITAMVAHVLRYFNRDFDYVIGAQLKGFDNTVKLSSAPVIVIEGDEYYASALDPTPKLVRYQHHIGLISGISWDHANVFPDEETYVRQFDIFADATPKGGSIIYCEQDTLALIVGKKERVDVQALSYKAHPHERNERGQYFLTDGTKRYPVKIFGTHNFQNLGGARELLRRIGITSEMFFEAITSFEGASGRLEKIKESSTFSVYSDFAHSPSKVKATVKALREMAPGRDLVACLELHTYSSLTKRFLPQYKDSMKAAHQQIIYINPEKMKSKRLDPLTPPDVKSAFNAPGIIVFENADELRDHLCSISWKHKNLLMMSSGNFGGLNIHELAESLHE
jgi:UDP-N-acetylmuramate: L-alanyl-gamma-D-glutamyl-meso-diaminopimelate ligase